MGLRPWRRHHHSSTLASCSAGPSGSHCPPFSSKDRSEAQTNRQKGIRLPGSRVMLHTKGVLSKQAKRLAKQADEHEQFIMKVTYSLGVLGFGFFCYLLGARPHDIPLLYAAFFIVAAPLRWVYYRAKKWHYFLLDFCYYANLICTFHLLFFSKSEKLFLLCFAFSEGPLAWALIVWRCSLVFSSLDKIVSVLIHLLPGTVIFIIRWWDPITFTHHPDPAEDGVFGPWPAWPQVESTATLWVWMFAVPLGVYVLWQLLYFAVVHGLRGQRLHKDPDVLTSFRELSRKASRANNFWWRLSGALGDDKRFLMYALIQAVFTVLTMAFTVPMFMSYRLHAAFQFFKIMTSIWNGGNFFFDVMPRQMHAKATAKKQLKQKQEQQQQEQPLEQQGQETSSLAAPLRDAAAVPLVEGQAAQGDPPTLALCTNQGVAQELHLVPGTGRPFGASTVGEREECTRPDRGWATLSSLALEDGSASALREEVAKPCLSCGKCWPRAHTAAAHATGSVESDDADQFLPALSEHMWMDGMSSWEEGVGENPVGLTGEAGLRRRPGAQETQGAAGLTIERSVWQGVNGRVACMG